MITAKEIKVVDKNSDYYGIPPNLLMENAGFGVSEFINKNFKKNKKIVVICGTGNNGGDGLVAARHLSKNYIVTVLLVGMPKDIKTKISKQNFSKLKKTNVKIIFSIEKIEKILEENEVIIDSMLGIGLTGNLREPYAKIVNKINKIKNKIIISVDIPTGLGTNNFVKPNYTITFHDKKIGMNKKNCGEIIIVDIGVPKKAIEYIGPGELSVYYPRPKKESHKGENGRLLIIGGGPYYGAPALASFAAQRTGVDLIYVAVPKKVAKAITSYSPLLIKPIRLAKNIAKISPTLIVKELNHNDHIVIEDLKNIELIINKIDALLIGPGLGSENATQKTIEKIIDLFIKHKKPIVVDADAIQVVGKKSEILEKGEIIVTPHTGEFKELTGVKLNNNLNDRKKNVEKWAKKLGITIVLKGPVDIISNGELTKLNDIHNVSMTVGGTGDVLAGIIAGLVSKKIDVFNAARIGVYINGAAGNIAYKKRSYGLIATDIIDEIPSVLNKYL